MIPLIASLVAAWACIVLGTLILAIHWDRRLESRDTGPYVGLDDILDRGLSDDTTEAQLYVWGDILRETPVALELAEPPGSVYIARSSLLLGQRVLTPAGTLIVPPWRQPLTAQLAVQQAGIGETTGVFARIIADHTGSAPETFGPREADLHPLYLDVT